MKYSALIFVIMLCGCLGPATGPAMNQAPPVMMTQDLGQTGYPRVEKVYFDADSTVISAQVRQVLQAVALIARMDQTIAIDLTGYTDQSHNPSLALRRAIAVRNGLSQMGVKPERMNVQDEAQSDQILGRQDTENASQSKVHRVDIVMRQQVDQAI